MESLEEVLRKADPLFSGLISHVIRITDESLREACEYEYGETQYGAGNAMPCGRDAEAKDSDGRPRCLKHL